MNLVEFLLSLKDKNNIIKAQNDLQSFLEFFNEEMFNKNFSYLNMSATEFLEKLKTDLNNASKEQIILLADSLLGMNKYFGNAFNKPLCQLVNNVLKNYIVRHPNEMDVSKYYKIVANSVFLELKQALNFKTKLNYAYGKNDFSGTAYSSKYGNSIDFSEDTIKGGNNRNIIFRIYQTLYHEQYHCLVGELENNPMCYKIDILNYQIVNTIKRSLSYEEGTAFYKRFYYSFKEEQNAELYGVKRAKEEILKLNPQFKISYMDESEYRSLIDKESHTSKVVKDKEEKRLESQESYFENVLDKIDSKIINKNGPISKMYNEDGTRKNFLTLINEWQLALQNNPHLSSDINNFYYYVVYRQILKTSEEELTNYLSDSYYANLIFQILENNKARLERENNNADKGKLYHLLDLYNKKQNKKVVFAEIARINALERRLQVLSMEKGENNGRK